MLTIVFSMGLAIASELPKLPVYYPMPKPGEFHYLPINQKPRIVEIPKKEKHELSSTDRGVPVKR